MLLDNKNYELVTTKFNNCFKLNIIVVKKSEKYTKKSVYYIINHGEYRLNSLVNFTQQG